MPFVANADYECFTEPIQGCCPDTKSSYTNKFQYHTPCDFCIYDKCINSDVKFSMEPIVYTKQSEGDNVAFGFVAQLHNITERIYHRYYRFPKRMIFTIKDKEIFD